LPEGVGNHPQVTAWRRSGIEWLAIVIRHAWHHQRAGRPYGGLQRRNQPIWPSLNRLYLREGTMHEQDAARCHAKLTELLRELVY
jgi:hypothetical protein